MLHQGGKDSHSTTTTHALNLEARYSESCRSAYVSTTQTQNSYKKAVKVNEKQRPVSSAQSTANLQRCSPAKHTRKQEKKNILTKRCFHEPLYRRTNSLYAAERQKLFPPQKKQTQRSRKEPRLMNLKAKIFLLFQLQTQQLSVPCGKAVIYISTVNLLQLVRLVTSTANLLRAYYSQPFIKNLK